MIDQQEQYRPRSKSIITGGLVTTFLGICLMFEGGPAIAVGIFVILCGISTLVITRFGARTWDQFSWWEWLLVGLGVALASLFLLVAKFTIWLVMTIVKQWFG